MRTRRRTRSPTTASRSDAFWRDSSWLFNLGADIYAWFTAQAAWRASCGRMAEQLAPIDPEHVLDLGCGPGVSTFELKRSLPRARVIGVDVAPRMLAQARRRQRGARVEWLHADAARLPIRDHSVDACTGHSFLYLVAHRRAVLEEVRRVLRPGGRVVFMEPHAQPATAGTILRVSRDPRHLVSVSLWRPFSRVHGRFSKSSLAQTLRAAGFLNVRVDETLGGLGLLACATAP